MDSPQMPKKSPEGKPAAKKAAKKVAVLKRPDEFEVLRRLQAAASVTRPATSFLLMTNLLDPANLALMAYENAATDRAALKHLNAALDASPASIDALLMLAEEADIPLPVKVAALTFIVRIARRALGKMIEKHRGALWSYLPARPFFRAKYQLAMAQREAANSVGALTEFVDMIELNTTDDHGVRYIVAPMLMAMHQYDRARGVLQYYARDNGVVFAWCWFALSFVHDDIDRAQALADALACNPHVEPLLRATDSESWDEIPLSFEPGSLEEARYHFENIFLVMAGVPGASIWLAEDQDQG